MKKHLGLIVLASLSVAALAAAQVPAPPAPPAAPAPIAAVPAPPAPPDVPGPALTPPAPPAPAWAATVAPQAPTTPAKPARPAKAPEAQKPPDPPAPTTAPEPPQPPQPGRERGEPDPVNIQFKVTVTVESTSAKPAKRVAILTVSNGTGSALQRGMLRAGNSVPVASTSLVTRTEDGKEAPVAKPLTSYNYRAVGLNVDVDQATVVSGNRVRAALNVEFSGVDEKTGPGAGGAPPSFPTFSQRVSLYLESGKSVLVAQSTDMATGVSQMVEVQATILR
jgi:hypothetical protein